MYIRFLKHNIYGPKLISKFLLKQAHLHLKFLYTDQINQLLNKLTYNLI